MKLPITMKLSTRENESVTLAAAPQREGYQFAGWLSLNGTLYKAGSALVLTGDEVFTGTVEEG